jgi:hypothetical protein
MNSTAKRRISGQVWCENSRPPRAGPALVVDAGVLNSRLCSMARESGGWRLHRRHHSTVRAPGSDRIYRASSCSASLSVLGETPQGAI